MSCQRIYVQWPNKVKTQINPWPQANIKDYVLHFIINKYDINICSFIYTKRVTQNISYNIQNCKKNCIDPRGNTVKINAALIVLQKKARYHKYYTISAKSQQIHQNICQQKRKNPDDLYCILIDSYSTKCLHSKLVLHLYVTVVERQNGKDSNRTCQNSNKYSISVCEDKFSLPPNSALDVIR